MWAPTTCPMPGTTSRTGSPRRSAATQAREEIGMKEAPVRRIVTGHDATGKAVIQEDGPAPRVQRIGGPHGPLFFEVWNTRGAPTPIDRASGEPSETGILLAP